MRLYKLHFSLATVCFPSNNGHFQKFGDYVHIKMLSIYISSIYYNAKLHFSIAMVSLPSNIATFSESLRFW